MFTASAKNCYFKMKIFLTKFQLCSIISSTAPKIPKMCDLPINYTLIQKNAENLIYNFNIAASILIIPWDGKNECFKFHLLTLISSTAPRYEFYGSRTILWLAYARFHKIYKTHSIHIRNLLYRIKMMMQFFGYFITNLLAIW